jgi:hypothetical protein
LKGRSTGRHRRVQQELATLRQAFAQASIHRNATNGFLKNVVRAE